MWRVSLFGRFEARRSGVPVAGLDARRVQELLCVLLLSADRSANREILADRLWPDTDSVRSKKYLRQTLWQLQRSFDRSGVDHSEHSEHSERSDPVMFVAEPEWVRISPGSDLWVDIVEFQRSYDIITKARGDLLSPEDCERLDSSVRLYRGELLEGWYYDWCREPREAFRSAYLTMLDCLMEQAELTADWRAGLMYGQLALREDRAYERAHLHVMRFHCLAGNRSAALRQFETCAAALREELEVEPDGEIQQFVQQVRRSGTSAVTNGALAQLVELVPAPPPALPSIEILSRMRTVTQLLDDMREEMVHRLVTLEALLR